MNCPDLSLSGLEHPENTSEPPLSAKHVNVLNQWRPQLTQVSQNQTVQETGYVKVKDVGKVTKEKKGEAEERKDKSDEEMKTDVVCMAETVKQIEIEFIIFFIVIELFGCFCYLFFKRFIVISMITSIPLMHHDSSDLRTLILIRIIPNKSIEYCIALRL